MARGLLAQTDQHKQAAFPALTLRIAPATALPAFPAVPDNYTARVPNCDLLPKLSWYVNQAAPRREICRAFWPLTTAEKPHRLLLLSGDSGIGKTALSAWALDLVLRLGARVRYVRVSEDKTPTDHVRILPLIWGIGSGAAVSPLRDPLPPPGQALMDQLADKTTSIETLYATFREALAEQAKAHPVTIVLDELADAANEGSFWILWKHFLAHVARGSIKNVSVILVLNDKEMASLDIENEMKKRGADHFAEYKHVPLQGMAVDEFIELLPDYLHFRSAKFHSLLPAQLDVLLQLIKGFESGKLRVAASQFDHWANYIAQPLKGI